MRGVGVAKPNGTTRTDRTAGRFQPSMPYGRGKAHGDPAAVPTRFRRGRGPLPRGHRGTPGPPAPPVPPPPPPAGSGGAQRGGGPW